MAKSTKCFSGILRRLLCTGSLPTHPSDQFIKSNTSAKQVCDQKLDKLLKPDYVEVKQHDGAPGVPKTPGVVARLMGLDSLPANPNSSHGKRTLGSYLRSRSVNSIDFPSHFDQSRKWHHHRHRRVRTSVSFREGLDQDYYGLLLPDLKETKETEELVIKKRHSKVKYGTKSDKLQEKNVGREPNRLYSGVAMHRKSKERRAVATKQVDCKEAIVGASKCLNKKKKQSLTHSNKVHSQQRGIKKVHFEATATPAARAKLSIEPVTFQKGDSNAHCDKEEARAIISESKSW